MTDDGFFREVNEELRSDKVKAIWTRYSSLLIGAVVAIVVGTAVFAFYEYWTEKQAPQSGDQFLAALNLVRDGKNDEALKTLDQLEKDGYGAYPVLARMRAAGVIAQKGDLAGAVAAFDKVSADTSIPQAIRDLAKLRAALILVDTGSYDDVASRVEALSSDSNPMRHSAREALGLAAWKAGRGADAAKLFQQISDDQTAPANIRQFADTMLDMLKSTGAAPLRLLAEQNRNFEPMSFTLAIIGRPNVGKSTLFNRLVGRKIALVDDLPGVTRDRRVNAAKLYDLKFDVIDTAGLEEVDSESLEGRMRAQTELAIGEADLILFLVDAKAGITPTDVTFADLVRRSGKPVILVANKAEARGAESGMYDPMRLVSANHVRSLRSMGRGFPICAMRSWKSWARNASFPMNT